MRKYLMGRDFRGNRFMNDFLSRVMFPCLGNFFISWNISIIESSMMINHTSKA